MSEDDADDRERAEAEALARALAGEPGAAGDAREVSEAPEDALQTAALLRYSAGEGELDAARAQAVLDRLTPAVRRRARSRGFFRAWPWGVGLAAAAALALLWVELQRAPAGTVAGRPDGAKTPAAPTASTASSTARNLPAPPPSLLSAQAELSRGQSADFAREMRAYRAKVLGALERRYPARLGLLSARGRWR